MTWWHRFTGHRWHMAMTTPQHDAVAALAKALHEPHIKRDDADWRDCYEDDVDAIEHMLATIPDGWHLVPDAERAARLAAEAALGPALDQVTILLSNLDMVLAAESIADEDYALVAEDAAVARLFLGRLRPAAGEGGE